MKTKKTSIILVAIIAIFCLSVNAVAMEAPYFQSANGDYIEVFDGGYLNPDTGFIKIMEPMTARDWYSSFEIRNPVTKEKSIAHEFSVNELYAIYAPNGSRIKDDDYIPTGAYFYINSDNGLQKIEAFIMGDVDSDGLVTHADANIALRAAIGLEGLRGAHFMAGNVTGQSSSELTTDDARSILRIADKLI